MPPLIYTGNSLQTHPVWHWQCHFYRWCLCWNQKLEKYSSNFIDMDLVLEDRLQQNWSHLLMANRLFESWLVVKLLRWRNACHGTPSSFTSNIWGALSNWTPPLGDNVYIPLTKLQHHITLYKMIMGRSTFIKQKIRHSLNILCRWIFQVHVCYMTVIDSSPENVRGMSHSLLYKCTPCLELPFKFCFLLIHCNFSVTDNCQLYLIDSLLASFNLSPMCLCSK